MITRNFLFIGLASVIASVPVATAEEAVKQHLATGADVNAKNERRWTPLHIAATKEIAELLIAAGADVNATEDWDGETPLHFAAENGHKEIAELLIDNGADVNAKSKGGYTRMPMTPLDKAKGEPWDSAEIKAALKETADLLREHGGKTGEELKAAGN
tara:strand:- start:326 stop:799 length:474 start_codon:yes stop_codon:yes gene_type:complete